MKIRFKLKFWGTISIVAIVVIIISQLIPYFENKAKHNERLEKVTKALELRERTRISFLNNIEKHYETLSKAYESNNLTQAYNELQLFKKYKKLDYKDITEINKKVMISILEESLKNIG